jgi:hypothetical protein
MSGVQFLKYTMKRGEKWRRLVVLKDRRTRRKRVPTSVSAGVLVDGVAHVLPATITAEGAVRLDLTPAQTLFFEEGTYPFDVVAEVSNSPLFTSTIVSERLVLRGEIVVKNLNNIAPMGYDSLQPEPLDVFED